MRLAVAVSLDDGSPAGDGLLSAERPATGRRHAPEVACGATIEVRPTGRVVVTLSDVLDATLAARLVEQLRATPPLGPVVIDVSAMILRRGELRALDSLVTELSGFEVHLSCPRLTGRRLLTHLLPSRPSVVSSPTDPAPWTTGAG